VENLVLVSKIVITPIYLICLLFLCGFGLHRYYLTWLFTRYKKVIPKPRAYFGSLPKVTIQLPIYNEQYVVERIIKSVCEIEYPKELLILLIKSSRNSARQVLIFAIFTGIAESVSRPAP
jgi:cellulose synthase/poly-beta-1,6-N-acetylglucosamine synthase-like glycosyltransferase